uniref:Uncharacterized protein n=1 Tax=Anguilla anguilla TaxID=7936 RepID=A0A0E9PM45_ANGAN
MYDCTVSTEQRRPPAAQQKWKVVFLFVVVHNEPRIKRNTINLKEKIVFELY